MELLELLFRFVHGNVSILLCTAFFLSNSDSHWIVKYFRLLNGLSRRRTLTKCLLLVLILENYLKIATELCSLAKSQGSRDNISVIVVFLKEPQLIATQNWPCKIQQSENIMENMNMCDEANLVTVDGLGNTKVCKTVRLGGKCNYNFLFFFSLLIGIAQ